MIHRVDANTLSCYQGCMSQLASIHLGACWLAPFPPPGCLVFYPAPRCHSLLFLAHLQLPALLCSPPDYTNKGLLRRHGSCHGENKPKESCWVCVTCFLGRSRMLISAKAAARSLSLSAFGRSREGPQRLLWGSKLAEALGRASLISICPWFVGLLDYFCI